MKSTIAQQSGKNWTLYNADCVEFSATMPAQIRRLAGTYLKNPDEINVKAKTSTATNITQRYLVVSYPQKVDALTRILEVEPFEGMIVFTRTKNETETLAEKLRGVKTTDKKPAALKRS